MRARLRLDRAGAEALTLLECPNCSGCFFPGLDPLPYGGLREPVLSMECEGALGLEASIDSLARIDSTRVKDFLDIGCGVGWTLDFGRRCLGWRTQGVDPSSAAAAGRSTLGVQIEPTLLEATQRGRRFDLVHACEVIEHVTDQLAFVTTARSTLKAGGVLLLRTPDAAALTEEAPRRVLDAVLCPGWHVVLHTERSLRRLLREAGFGVIKTWVEGATVHAAAAAADFSWTPGGRFDDTLSAYLGGRAAELEAASSLRSGLLLTLFRRFVRSGDYERARGAYATLREALAARHAVDPESWQPADLERWRDSGTDRAAFPVALCGALHHRGLLAWHGDHDRVAAGRYFRAAGTAWEVLARSLDGTVDFGVRAAIEEADLYAQASSDGDSASAGPLACEDELASWADRGDALARLVGLGAFAIADRLVESVDEDLFKNSGWPAGPAAVEAGYAFAMLLLHHRADFAGAAERFARLHQVLSSSRPGPAGLSPDRLWPARFHEAYARYRAGELDRSGEILRELLELPEDCAPPLSADLRDHARAILSQPGLRYGC